MQQDRTYEVELNDWLTGDMRMTTVRAADQDDADEKAAQRCRHTEHVVATWPLDNR